MRDTRPRLDEGAYIGITAALLTFCTAMRRPVFVVPANVERARLQFVRAAVATDVAIVAYCFMPDHLHLMTQATGDRTNMARFASLAKQYSGYHHGRETGDRLWQPSWHDRMLRRSDDFATVIRYVLNNPIRSGLVQSLEDYPFLGSQIMSREALMESVQL